MAERRDISIKVPVLARVEGEGALDIEVRDGKIEELKLCNFEPPRLFEKFLEERSYDEVADIVARICGICPTISVLAVLPRWRKNFLMKPNVVWPCRSLVSVHRSAMTRWD